MQTTFSTRRVNGVSLHIAEAGPEDGPLVILLHGFPGFWWDWRHQIGPLASRGFRVVAPDQRGYNLSEKPKRLRAYNLDALAGDVAALADSYGRSRFCLAGHDWGGVIAWRVAARWPQRVERLAILNAPHPDVWGQVIRRCPSQALRSTYAAFFQLPWLPEALLSARGCALLKRTMRGSARPRAFSDQDIERYVEAWSQPEALTSMLNYYRAFVRRPRGRAGHIQPRTLLIWGERDAFLLPEVARQSLAMCDSGDALFLSRGTHWTQMEEVAKVNKALIGFFRKEERPQAPAST